MPIAFDSTGFQQHDQSNWYHPATGDQVSLTYFDLVPDLPAPLEDLTRLRHDLAVITGEVGCLIESHVVQLGGVPALLQIVKLPLPNQPSGQCFIASFTIPRANCSAVLKIQAVERGTTGVREAVLVAQIGFDRWVMPHPYAPEVQGRLPFHAGDDPRFDPQFADHPLTRVRAWTHHVMRTAHVDPRFAALPPFQGAAPAPAPDLPPLFNSNLVSAVPGIPIGGHIALQIGERTTYWRMTDQNLVERLGRGVMGRSPLTENRFRDLVLVDEETGGLLIPDRYTTDGAMTGLGSQLTRVTPEEADAAVTPDACMEAFSWVGRMSAAARERREWLTVEPIENQGERRDPFVLLAFEYEGEELRVLASASPTPSENTWFQGQPTLSAPAKPETIEGIGRAAMTVVNEWGSHPLRMALTFTRPPEA